MGEQPHFCFIGGTKFLFPMRSLMHAIDLPVQLVQCANECFSFFLGDLRPFFVWSNCETNTLCADVYKKACGQLRTNMRLSAQSLVSRSWRTKRGGEQPRASGTACPTSSPCPCASDDRVKH